MFFQEVNCKKVKSFDFTHADFKKQKGNFKKILENFKKFFLKKREKRGNFKKDCKKIHKKSVSKGLIDMYLNHIVDMDDSFSKKMKKY